MKHNITVRDAAGRIQMAHSNLTKQTAERYAKSLRVQHQKNGWAGWTVEVSSQA